MKLQELDKLKPFEKAKQVLESRLAHTMRIDEMSVGKSTALLGKVQKLIAEHRETSSFHKSERNPAYLKLIMLEQALKARLAENPNDTVMVPVDTKDPKVQQTLKKAQGGQNLTPDEQKLVTALASQKKEGKKAKRVVKESEVQQAQVVLAAQDIVDRVQGMLEDISEMQFKDLPALTNSIRNDIGTDQASQYQSAASAALSQLLTAIQEGKTAMEAAQGILTGQEPIVPGEDDGLGDLDALDTEPTDAMPPRDNEDELDIDDEGPDLGRERR